MNSNVRFIETSNSIRWPSWNLAACTNGQGLDTTHSVSIARMHDQVLGRRSPPKASPHAHSQLRSVGPAASTKQNVKMQSVLETDATSRLTLTPLDRIHPGRSSRVPARASGRVTRERIEIVMAIR